MKSTPLRPSPPASSAKGPDHRRDRLPRDFAGEVERGDFHATPGSLSQAEREAANRRIQRYLKKIREGTGKAGEANLRTLETEEAPREGE